MEIWPGRDHPLGAHADAHGTNFALFSDGAQAVQLCLFDDAGAETRLPLTEVDGYVWHGYVPGVGAGQHYGYRVEGPWEPANGLRFNASKLLLDPYARAVSGHITWGQPMYAYDFAQPLLRNDAGLRRPHLPERGGGGQPSTGLTPTAARTCGRMCRTTGASFTRPT